EVPQGNSSHILLYAVSSSFRQTFPAEVLVLDTNASVSGTSFLDEDLDVGQVGGQVFWDLPEETAQVTGYLVYLSSSANRSIISQLPTTTTAVDLLPDTDMQQFSQVVVYTRSALVEQTTPDAVQLSDVQVTVENLEFVDQDLDAWELGGNATWWANDSAVVGYKVYLSNSSSGLARQPVGNLLVQRYLEVPEDTPLGDLRFLLVYTVSGLTEQTTPAALVFNDTESSVQQLEFLDKDLDVDQLGGAVTWRLPEEYAEVALYAVYLGTSAAGAGRSLVGSTVATQLDVPLDTPLQAFSHVLVYSTSVYEQSTPVALAFNDSSLQVQDLSFTDQDLDDYHLGGPVSWAPPIDTDVLEGYVVYLAGSSLGDERQLLGNVTVGSNEFLVPADTALANHSHLLVYTRSDFGEASVPAAVPILDVVSRVSDIIFVDKDLDEQELGGNVTWTPPPDLRAMPVLQGGDWYYTEGEKPGPLKEPEQKAENKPGHRPLGSYQLPKWVYHPERANRRIVINKEDYFGMAADGLRNFDLWNVAHVAAYHDDLKLLSLATLEQCMEPNRWGMTPMHMTGLGQHPYGPSLCVLWELIQLGAADPEALNSAEQTPWHIAQRMQKPTHLKKWEKAVFKGGKPDEYEAKKQAQLRPRGKYARALGLEPVLREDTQKKLPVCLVFPGQGSQCVGMLRQQKDLPAVRQMLSKAKEILGYDLEELLMNGPEDKLAQTKHCQPA
ncbi:unnamed protein product, partial [Effrenium voratum]